MYTPPLSPASRARFSIAGALGISCRESRSHCTSEPPIATDPSRAYTGSSPSIWYETVLSRPCSLNLNCSPVLSRRNRPVP